MRARMFKKKSSRFFFAGGGDRNSRKPDEKTTRYLPLVPKGSYVEDHNLENLLKILAPVYMMHYENLDPVQSFENVDPEKFGEKFA